MFLLLQHVGSHDKNWIIGDSWICKCVNWRTSWHPWWDMKLHNTTSISPILSHQRYLHGNLRGPPNANPRQKTMVVYSPLIRPYFLGKWHWGDPLRFPWYLHVSNPLPQICHPSLMRNRDGNPAVSALSAVSIPWTFLVCSTDLRRKRWYDLLPQINPTASSTAPPNTPAALLP